MDYSTSLLRLTFLALGAALILLVTRSAFRLPLAIDAPAASFLHGSGGCTRFSPWACRPPRTGKSPPRRSSHESDVPRHPLDPLTVTEISRARELLRAHPPFASAPSALVVHALALDEPDKPAVRLWRKGAHALPPRRAVAVVRFRGESHVLALDLATGSVTPLPTPASGYPTMTMDEMTGLCAAPFSDPAFNATILRRGVRLADVACLPISPGWYGPAEDDGGRRLIKSQCYSTEGTANFYMRPIEGLTVLIDMDTGKVVHISDRGAGIPIPAAKNTEYRHAANDDADDKFGYQTVRAPSMEPAPEGPGFEVSDGHTVRWAGWEFHLKADARAGLIVSRATVQDPATGARREVMYKGMASELFVPYMDPTGVVLQDVHGRRRVRLRAAGHAAGAAQRLPRHARYMDGVFVAADGRPYVRRR
ncbi:hypothetical protein ZWY2020_005362 [Hordeum vulgare]|nr:hypothetical protein ZWY2020_005362 [Hordeum vulgare]